MKQENRLSTNAGRPLPFATACQHNGALRFLEVDNG